MEENKEQDFEIADVEDFREPITEFSHQSLVMTCLKRCLENGGNEMVEGLLEQKKDKLGNVLTTYRPDTRKKFIESIKTAKNFMSCDFDDEALEKISKALKKIREREEYWKNQEWKWWCALTYAEKHALTAQRCAVTQGMFNRNNQFYDNYLDDELDIYRRILEQLNKLTKRLDFYKLQDAEG